MKRIYLGLCSLLLVSALAAQELYLMPAERLPVPAENPWGVTFHKDKFWVSDVETGEIFSFHKDREILHRIKAPRKNISALCFKGDELWVLADSWDTLVYPHHSLPKTQAYKLDAEDGTPLDSVIVPYYNVPAVSERFMYGIAWFDSSLLVSYNGGYGPAMMRINPADNFTSMCCAHPTGLEVIHNELWSVRYNEPGPDGDVSKNMILPVILDDSGSYEDFTRAMQFDFFASDLAFDGSHYWLLDPRNNTLVKMITDSLPGTDPGDPGDPGNPGNSLMNIEWLEVVPARPDVTDQIRVVAHTTFSSGGCQLREKTIRKDSGVHISAAHETGMLTYICESADTFNIGKLPAGYHEITYSLSVTDKKVKAISKTLRIFVQDTLQWHPELQLIPVQPVAGEEVRLITKGICYVHSFYDILRRHISIQAFYNSCSLDICGTDTLSLGFLSADSYTLDYYLYDICLSDTQRDSLVWYESLKLDIGNITSGDDFLAGQEPRLWPNPSKGYLNLALEENTSNTLIRIYSVNGRLLHQERLMQGERTHRLDVSHLRTGYYILNLSNNGHMSTHKISIIK